MSGLSISRAWEEAKARLAADGKLMVAVALALILLPQTIVALVGPPALLSGVEPGAGFNLLLVAATIVTLIGQLAVARLAIGPATNVGGAIAHAAGRLLPLLGAVVILMLAVFLVSIPLMILLGGTAGLDAAAAGNPTGALGVAILVISVLVILLGAKFLLIIPVATAETGGPIHILKRSWALSSGHFLKLVGLVILLIVVALIVSLAVQLGGGTLIQLFFDIKPFSLGALLYGLLFGALQAGITVPLTALLCTIYLQVVRGSLDVSAPKSGT